MERLVIKNGCQNNMCHDEMNAQWTQNLDIIELYSILYTVWSLVLLLEHKENSLNLQLDHSRAKYHIKTFI